MSTKDRFFAKKKHVILTVLGALVVLWASVTIIYPLIIGNGLDKYNTVQREAAQSFIDYEERMRSPASMLVKVHVDNIRPSTTEEQANCSPARRTQDPNSGLYYTIEYTAGSWGGLDYAHRVMPTCAQH